MPDKKNRTDSQTKRILAHLQKGKSINPIYALGKFGCFRLGARIYDLKKKGYSIATTLIKDGDKVYASYKLTDKNLVQ